MRELRTRMQTLVFGLAALFAALILALANGFAYWQAVQTVQANLDSTSRLFNERGYDRELDILSSLPVCTVLLNHAGEITGVLARDPDMDEEDLIEAVEYSMHPEPDFLYTSRYVSRRQGSMITIVDTAEVAEHLQEILWGSLLLGAVLLVLLWFGTRWLILVMTRPIEENLEMQKRFVADASHELKTPLSVIMASAEAMEQDPQPRWLQAIITESEQMNHLITSLLDLSRSDGLKDKQPVNLSETVEQAALPFESLLYDRHLSLALDLEPGLTVAGAPEDLMRLTGILIDNASRHADPGTAVSVLLKREKDRILLRVTDTGEAIPAGEEERIFDRFYRADASRTRAEGRYGLGLAIAKNITTGHHADIRAWSHGGQTTFQVRVERKTEIPSVADRNRVNAGMQPVWREI